MILRAAKSLMHEDQIRIRHERYKDTHVFVVIKVEPIVRDNLPFIKVTTTAPPRAFGPCMFLHPDDLVEVILE